MGKGPLTCYAIDFADRRRLFTFGRQTPRQPDHPTIIVLCEAPSLIFH